MVRSHKYIWLMVLGVFGGALLRAEPPEGKKGRPGWEYKGVNVQLGGFAASETAYRTHNMESDIGTPFNKIPFANSAGYDQTEFRGTERQSRFSLLADGDVSASMHLAAYYELDFLGTSPTANPNESNSFTPRTRHVYGTLDDDELGLHILAGQNWSLATMNAKGITPRNEYIPATIDAQYAVGFDWARQWQFRVAKDWNKTLWAAISIENSQTVGVAGTLAAGTGNVYQLPAGALFNPGAMSINGYPDLIAKVAYESDFGHFEVLGLARNFESRYGGTTTASQTNKQNIWTAAAGAGVVVPVVNTFDVAVSGLLGKGIGRYGTSQLADATYASDGSLVPLNGAQYLAELTWHATQKLDVYVAYGQETVNAAVGSGGTYGYGDNAVVSNAGCGVLGGNCAPNLKSVTQGNLGLWWSVYKGEYGQAKLGAQYSYTTLTTYADQSGNSPSTNINMLFTSLRYYPF